MLFHRYLLARTCQRFLTETNPVAELRMYPDKTEQVCRPRRTPEYQASPSRRTEQESGISSTDYRAEIMEEDSISFICMACAWWWSCLLAL
ncbi:hypothetical protein BaRGS_00038185 [Batillaria attramentaria]|uniref:Uncharacterized protein n=1 Tax=Batillaria attramentaria TaxID=370345 RepID=A0ABD0J7C7_9CAEN